jgi:hypothetical protein
MHMVRPPLDRSRSPTSELVYGGTMRQRRDNVAAAAARDLVDFHNEAFNQSTT